MRAESEPQSAGGSAALSPALLEILACPVTGCHAPLRLETDRLVCTRCGLRYRIEARWPVLIPEEADPPLR